MGSLISVDHNSRSIEAVAPVLTRNLQVRYAYSFMCKRVRMSRLSY